MKKPIAAAVFFGLCITAIVYLVIKPSSSSQREAQRRTKRRGEQVFRLITAARVCGSRSSSWRQKQNERRWKKIKKEEANAKE